MNIQKKEGESAAVFFAKNFLSASFSACVAETLTLPIDTAKVRLQIQAKSNTEGAPKYSGFIGTMRTVAREETVFGLWNGLSAGLQR